MQQTLIVETVQRLTDKEARIKIKERIQQIKNSGQKGISIIELLELELPVE